MSDVLMVVVNGQELVVQGKKFIFTQLPSFHDPVIAHFGRDRVEHADVDVGTVELFF
jgi:hypothetical protein